MAKQVINLKHGVTDTKGREVGHNLYVWAYDPVGEVEQKEKAKAFSIKYHEVEMSKGGQDFKYHATQLEQYRAYTPVPSRPANVKFLVCAQITRDGEDFGATQNARELKAQTLEEALAEAMALGERLRRDTIKKYNKSK